MLYKLYDISFSISLNDFVNLIMFQNRYTEATLHNLRLQVANRYFTTNASGCKIWTGAICHSGYPRIRVTVRTIQQQRLRKVVTVGRLVLFLKRNGRPIQPFLQTSHLCHNKLCFNETHLVLETRQQNCKRKICKRVRRCNGHRHYPKCIV